MATQNYPGPYNRYGSGSGMHFLAKSEISKEAICTYVTNTFNYRMNRTLDEILPKYHFHVSCQGDVPVAVIAFRESRNYEDAVQKAVSLGGNSNTIACMADAIAEAYYGIPEEFKQAAMQFLDPETLGDHITISAGLS